MRIALINDAQQRVNTSFWDATGCIILLLLASWAKRWFEFSPAIKELHAKHYSMLLCLNGYAFTQGSKHYQPNATDVFVVTPGRSGTMFMINLLHQLRTGGDISFDHVERLGHHFVPITGAAFDYLNSKQHGSPPQLFYTHGLPDQVPDGARYVYVQRNPLKIVQSWHFMTKQFYALRNYLTIEDFYYNCARKHCFFPEKFIFHHIAEWWRRKMLHSSRILWTNFELLTKNGTFSKQYANRIAKFCSISIGSTAKRRAMRPELRTYLKGDFEDSYGKTRFNLYDMQIAVALISDSCMNNDAYLFFTLARGIRSMKDLGGQKPVLPDTIRRDANHLWRSIVKPATGFLSYEHMRQFTTSNLEYVESR